MLPWSSLGDAIPGVILMISHNNSDENFASISSKTFWLEQLSKWTKPNSTSQFHLNTPFPEFQTTDHLNWSLFKNPCDFPSFPCLFIHPLFSSCRADKLNHRTAHRTELRWQAKKPTHRIAPKRRANTWAKQTPKRMAESARPFFGVEEPSQSAGSRMRRRGRPDSKRTIRIIR